MLVKSYFIVLLFLFNKLIEVAVNILCKLGETRSASLIEGVADHRLLVGVVVPCTVLVQSEEVGLVR